MPSSSQVPATETAAPELRTLDVRPILEAGGEPFAEIMQAVGALAPGQGLRLIANFKPVPLFSVMAKKGFSHREQPLAGKDWEVVFTPEAAAAPATPPAPKAATAADDTPWAKPSLTLDNRGLPPPEPMVRILEAMSELHPGEVLEVLNDRDPVFLYPKLAERGHEARATPLPGKGVHLLIRHGRNQPGETP